MNEKYEIGFWQDNIYAVYLKSDYLKGDRAEAVFRGTIEEVNAWLSLKEKGFDI